MILLNASRELLSEPLELELPRPKMVMDPRPNNHHNFSFECAYTYRDDGITIVTLTRTDNLFDHPSLLYTFRVYDTETETVPDFTSTIYTYMGIENERAPSQTTVLFIHPSVDTIKACAFHNCNHIHKCIMHDGVHTIERSAFFGCSVMTNIRLSKNLKRIGYNAFNDCTSLEAVFLPSTIEEINHSAFYWCENLRIVPLPSNMDIANIKSNVFDYCFTFFDTTKLKPYERTDVEYRHEWDNNYDEVHQAMIDFYRNCSPLHKVCLDTNVTAKAIQECINMHGTTVASIVDHDGMTPLHILAMNPHASITSLEACFDANMNAAITNDSRDKLPLEYLIEYDNLEGHVLLVTALCLHWDRRRGTAG